MYVDGWRKFRGTTDTFDSPCSQLNEFSHGVKCSERFKGNFIKNLKL